MKKYFNGSKFATLFTAFFAAIAVISLDYPCFFFVGQAKVPDAVRQLHDEKRN